VGAASAVLCEAGQAPMPDPAAWEPDLLKKV
jgi:hypothetical protein